MQRIKTIVSLDWNGVFVANRKGVRRYLQKRTGLILPSADCYERIRIVGKTFRRERGGWGSISQQTYKELLDELYATPELFVRWIPPMKDAVAVCNELLSDKRQRYFLQVVSKLRSARVECIEAWLWHHKVAIDLETMYEHVHILDQRETKTSFYRASHVVIEDEFEHLDHAMISGSMAKLLLMASQRTAHTLRFKSGHFAPIQLIRRWTEIRDVIRNLNVSREAA